LKNILVVDDEVGIQTLLVDVLTAEDYKVFVSDGGEEFIDIIKKEDIDLVILDMMMPKGSGQEIYTAMKVVLEKEGLKDKIPYGIILTAHPGSESSQFLLMMESGIKKLVAKPFQISELLEAIKEVIKK
jgi:DNA-binding response OmpR family regulator